MDLNDLACKKIRALRIKKNISQKDLATKLAIERSTYNKIETNKTELTLRTIEKIANVLDTDIQTLLNLKDVKIVSNNTGTLSAQGINTTLNLNIPLEAIEELKKIFSSK